MAIREIVSFNFMGSDLARIKSTMKAPKAIENRPIMIHMAMNVECFNWYDFSIAAVGIMNAQHVRQKTTIFWI